MKIKYVQINDTTVKALAVWDKEYPEYLDGNICEILIKMGYLARNDIQMPKEFSAIAMATGADKFDYKTGCNVARDKVLMKYHAELAKVCDKYETALEKYLERIGYLKYISEQKVDRAYNRYVNY